MPTYKTFSEYAPSNRTGDLSAALIQTVPNNSAHTGAYKINWPSYYDQFVNKTATRSNQPIVVTQEAYDVLEPVATTGNQAYLYLHHLPSSLNGSSIVASDGTLDTGQTDYTNGILYFSDKPTGDFTVNYIAQADSFHGDHINVLQNAAMQVQDYLGAGSATGEGLRNAEFWVLNYPPALQSRLPNALHTEAADRDVALKGDETGTITVTLGNGGDTVTTDAAIINWTSTDASQRITGNLLDSDEDGIYINGPVAITATGGIGLDPDYTGCAFSVGDYLQSTWTGVPGAGPYAAPHADWNPLVRFFGDLQVVGSVYVEGDTFILSTATGTSVSMVSESLSIGSDLFVTGDTTLGWSQDQTVSIGGDTTIGGFIHVQGLQNEVSRFDTAIDVRNQGNTNNGLGGLFADAFVERGTQRFPDLPYHVGKGLRTTAPGDFGDLTVNKNFTVDGLDPSYIAKLLSFRANDRHDWTEGGCNLGAYDGITGEVTSSTSPATSLWVDTGICWPTGAQSGFSAGMHAKVIAVGEHPFRWFHQGGGYYHGMFQNEMYTVNSGEWTGDYQFGDGNEWMVLWTNDDTTQGLNPGAQKFGARVPMKRITVDYNAASPWNVSGASVELSRAFNTPVVVGDAYQIYHPHYSYPRALRYDSSSTIAVYASEAEPLIGNTRGVHKVLTTQCTESITNSFTGLHFVYMSCKTPEIAESYGGYLLDSEPKIVVTTEFAPSEGNILVGEFYSTDPGAGVDNDSIITYNYNQKYDSMWMRCQGEENLYETVTGTAGAGSSEFAWRSDTGELVTLETGKIETQALYMKNEAWGDILVDDTKVFRTRIHHNFGTMERVRCADFKVFVAPNYGTDYTEHGSGSDLREGPDYGYVQELEQMVAVGTTPYPTYEVIHSTRNYTDIVIHELDKLPAALIPVRTTDGQRNFTLTGTLGDKFLTGVIDERTRNWWWVRCVMS